MDEAGEKRFFREHKGDLAEFEKEFPDEQSCRDRLFEARWPDGYKCPRCGKKQGYYLHRTRDLYQCKNNDCKYQASVKSGTMFFRSRVPLKIWFHMIFVLGCSNYVLPLSGLIKYRREYSGKGDYRKTVLSMTEKIISASSKKKRKYLNLVKFYKEDETD